MNMRQSKIKSNGQTNIVLKSWARQSRMENYTSVCGHASTGIGSTWELAQEIKIGTLRIEKETTYGCNVVVGSNVKKGDRPRHEFWLRHVFKLNRTGKSTRVRQSCRQNDTCIYLSRKQTVAHRIAHEQQCAFSCFVYSCTVQFY